MTSQDARVLTDAAEAAGLPLLVGHHRRHNGMVQAAKAVIANGDIGDVRAVQFDAISQSLTKSMIVAVLAVMLLLLVVQLWVLQLQV